MKKAHVDKQIQVQILEVGYHPTLPNELRTFVRYLRYSSPVPCAECGNEVELHWTMLVSFYAARIDGFTMKPGKVQLPLTPVCSFHPLGVPTVGDTE